MENELKIGRIVEIPSSNLGKMYGQGVITAYFGGTIQVNFSGHLGQYTISKHEIKIVS